MDKRKRVECLEVGIQGTGETSSGEVELELQLTHNNVEYYGIIYMSREFHKAIGKAFPKPPAKSSC